MAVTMTMAGLARNSRHSSVVPNMVKGWSVFVW